MRVNGLKDSRTAKESRLRDQRLPTLPSRLANLERRSSKPILTSSGTSNKKIHALNRGFFQISGVNASFSGR